ncbi:MAG: class I tRNA ligase family protein, partial [Alphaproteobacteria bacterium]|nr:class I tRNA ligase family protein [Alphaproteobacteria bacterium]
TKLWNAARFCALNECRPNPDFAAGACTAPVNRWIVGELRSTVGRTAAALESYRFNEAADALYHFVWGTFCDWYLEFAKPVLYGADESAKTETRATAGWALVQTLKALHPFMPFITEELYGALAETDGALLMKQSWPDLDAVAVDDEARAEMDWVVGAISEIRSVRAAMNVPPGAKIPLRHKDASPTAVARLAAHGDLVRQLARVSEIEVGAAAGHGDLQVLVDEVTLILPLGDVIDIDREKARLEKEAAKLAGEAAKIEKKLGNKDFLARAPEHVIEEQRQRRAEADQSRRKIEDAVARLSAA